MPLFRICSPIPAITDLPIPSKVVRLTRRTTTGSAYIVCYVVEFTGSNWTVNTVSDTFGAPDGERTVSIGATLSNVNQTFLYYTTRMVTGTTRTCASQNKFIRISSTTQLTTWRDETTGDPGLDPFIAYLISNPQLSVKRYGTSWDLTGDWTALEGTTQNETVDALPSDATLRLALLQAGSSDATSNAALEHWVPEITSTTNVQAVRATATGDTEFHIETVDFSGLSATPITDRGEGYA